MVMPCLKLTSPSPPGFSRRMGSPASSHSQRVRVRPTSQHQNMGSASIAPPASVGLSAGIKVELHDRTYILHLLPRGEDIRKVTARVAFHFEDRQAWLVKVELQDTGNKRRAAAGSPSRALPVAALTINGLLPRIFSLPRPYLDDNSSTPQPSRPKPSHGLLQPRRLSLVCDWKPATRRTRGRGTQASPLKVELQDRSDKAAAGCRFWNI